MEVPMGAEIDGAEIDGAEIDRYNAFCASS